MISVSRDWPALDIRQELTERGLRVEPGDLADDLGERKI